VQDAETSQTLQAHPRKAIGDIAHVERFAPLALLVIHHFGDKQKLRCVASVFISKPFPFTSYKCSDPSNHYFRTQFLLWCRAPIAASRQGCRSFD
jgi:hypothetical protein